ncbi:Major facilitator superfamily domain general substrate transporter [Penicillium angulare]|uniref:Major facilitator superfamily domain general substrate transporter n=1 Tax=Penicillium angulare TaxID=116970 RepID=UPI00253FC197|nr:Major facilitator superfamily domain general substrate transporter [Penicillium angulare]KAJ5266605.1 Major facilitator superfamily domain general substrate transporter [Penicillium angulare]
MSTQTQTESFILQTIASDIQVHHLEPQLLQELEPTAPPPPKWLYPKIFSAGISFFSAGINDGSLGSLIPYVIRSYNIGTNMVSLLYGITFFGWLFAAISSSFICQHLDLGAMLSLGASIQILAHVLRVWLPPFPLYAVTFFFASLGQAYNDMHANTFVSTQKGAHRWLGFIHAMYMAGCLVGPFAATAVASADTESQWNLFYYLPLAVGVGNLCAVGISFHDRVGFLGKRRNLREGEDHDPDHNGQPRAQTDGGSSAGKNALKEIRDTLSTPGVWLLSLFFFFFLGAAVTAGGWMVEYLVNIRNGDVKEMGYIPAGFYGGAFLGRLLLAEPTHRLGERRMIFIYAVLCVGLQLVFWLLSVPNIITEAVAVSLLGFFSGPFFATVRYFFSYMLLGVSVGSKIFAPEILSPAISFVFVLGQIGGSIFPAITGLIAAHFGVKVLQPILVGLLGTAGISWLVLPKDLELHRD